MKVKRNKGFFSISAVAKMFTVHQQTIRLYEKEGLLTPKRSSGNTRLFSEEDVNRLEEIIYLTHQLGINLAGVEMILKLKRQISKMQKDMNKIFDDTHAELTKEGETSKEQIKSSMKRLLEIKKDSQLEAQHHEQAPSKHHAQESHDEEQSDIDNWDIEYEEE